MSTELDLEKGFAKVQEGETTLGDERHLLREVRENPKYRVGHDGTLICHDPILSASPEALLDFILKEASSAPVPVITISGSHQVGLSAQALKTALAPISISYNDSSQETRVTVTTQIVNGVPTPMTSTHQVTITDFSASYSLQKECTAGLGYAPEGVARAVVYTQGEWDVAFRGGTKKERGGRGSDVDVEMPREERKALEADWKARKLHGMPPFVHPASLRDIASEAPLQPPPASFAPDYFPARMLQGHYLDFAEDHSTSPPFAPSRYHKLLEDRDGRVREMKTIARDFCSSTNSMRELHVKKGTYGWDWAKLDEDVTRIIRSTGYSNTISVTRSTPTKCDIMIRPDSAMGIIFSSRWYWKALLWLVLVYPILLIIEKLMGARFTAIRVAFPLVRWRILPGASPDMAMDQATALAAPLGGGYRWPVVTQLPTDGTWVYRCGLSEDEWLSSVEERLRSIVASRSQGVSL